MSGRVAAARAASELRGRQVAAAERRLAAAVREFDGELVRIGYTEAGRDGALVLDHAVGIGGRYTTGQLAELGRDPGVAGGLDRLTELGEGTWALHVHQVLKGGAL